MSFDPASHYDRVTSAWDLLLGDELHYGVFVTGRESLPEATNELTRRMEEAMRLEPGLRILDVGCGTGTTACSLALRHEVRIVGITTSAVGVERATARADAAGVRDRVVFERRDGMDNGLPDACFDRVWVLESSHLMRERDRLIAECARVLGPGGRLALCDIVRRRPIPFDEVRRLRQELTLLRDVFGDARMDEPADYERLAQEHGLDVEAVTDLTAETRPTFDRWRDNADRHREAVAATLGEEGLSQFVTSCDVLERFWDDGTLGYALLSASKPSARR